MLREGLFHVHGMHIIDNKVIGRGYSRKILNKTGNTFPAFNGIDVFGHLHGEICFSWWHVALFTGSGFTSRFAGPLFP